MNKNSDGFTIVELMVGMIAFSLMVAVVGSMLFYGWLGWRRNTESVNMQRDALIAMNAIAREIRNSSISEVSGDAAGIYFTVSSPVVVRTSAMSYLASDIAISPGINIRNFGVNIASNTVDVGFSLYTGDGADGNDYRMLINVRN